MKSTVVPAQVTTVEDRIAGNLGVSQLMLLSAPVFGGSALYIILPPNFHSAMYKIVVITVLALICGMLAVRIKGKIVLLWLIVLLRYNLRPHYYVFNKNSLVSRETFKSVNPIAPEPKEAEPRSHLLKPSAISAAALAHITEVMNDPASSLTFSADKKGGLRVLITEIKEQS